ncbi:MAG: hypothetical protein HQL03_01945 [Nitrospirae bacterium]|nr:hypothetical protein [Nitrospirota bacterium]
MVRKKVMEGWIVVCTTVMFFTFGFLSVAYGESKPTKEETIKFIQDKCDNLKITDSITSRVFPDSKDSCTLILELKYAKEKTIRFIVPLKEIDQTAIKTGFNPYLFMYTGDANNTVQLYTKEENKERKKAIKQIVESYNTDKKDNRVEAYEISANIHCTDELIAERVAKAVANLVDLCGGANKEPF